MKELRTANLTWKAAKRTAKDRRKWRTTVEALCFTRREVRGLSQVSKSGINAGTRLRYLQPSIGTEALD
jgi:ribosomal protein L32E